MNMKLSKCAPSIIKWYKENEKRFGLPSHYVRVHYFTNLGLLHHIVWKLGRSFPWWRIIHIWQTMLWRHELSKTFRVLDHGCCSWSPSQKITIEEKQKPKYVLEHFGSFSYGVARLPLKNHYLDQVRTWNGFRKWHFRDSKFKNVWGNMPFRPP